MRFLVLLPRSFVLVRCLREANIAIFCSPSIRPSLGDRGEKFFDGGGGGEGMVASIFPLFPPETPDTQAIFFAEGLVGVDKHLFQRVMTLPQN